MSHGLNQFAAASLVEKAKGALDIIERAAEGGGEVHKDAMHEALCAALENQIAIAETLALIKVEFDKFEEGISKIL